MNGYKIQQVLAIWHSVQIELSHAETDAEDMTPNLIYKKMDTANTNVTELLSFIVMEALTCEDLANAAIDRAKTIRKRSEWLLAKAEKLRHTALEIMQVVDMRRLVRPEFTASVGEGRAKVVITDETAIPDEYMRIVKEPIKSEIAADLKYGVIIPGAEMSETRPTLRVRTK